MQDSKSKPSARRLRGVFVWSVDLLKYKGPPVRKYDYFPSTRAASKFLGYKSDAVHAAMLTEYARGSGYAFMGKRGVWFISPWAAAEKHARYMPEVRQALRREFPEWFTDEVGRVGRNAQPSEDYSI
jgi:hypothetical protein